MTSYIAIYWLESLVSLPHSPITLVLDQYIMVPFAETFAVAVTFSDLQQILLYQHILLAVLL